MSQKSMYELSIDIQIRQTSGAPGTSYGGLSVRETVSVKADGFLEMAAILAKFHELANIVKEK